ncbi:MAG: response regulator transcription factor [Elusimicrobia bacterium]|nr:response regulator transcription factor [Elusimicrobiota bacterium]
MDAMAGRGKGAILIVDDERDLRRGLQHALVREGYSAKCAGSAEEALRGLGRLRPDAIVLDVMFPGMDGIEFCRRLRQTHATPVLFLSARKSELDRILGLRVGGDDYLTKPFGIGELLARLQALLRRARGTTAQGAPVRVGDLELDASRHEARLKGRVLGLSPKEFDCLRLLLQAEGRVLSRAELLRRVWRIGDDLGVATRTVDQHMTRLRAQLGREAKRLITLPRVGYRFLR